MDKKIYKIGGIIFKIILNSKKYKIEDLFNEPQPYNLYINYHILEINSSKIDETIIINNTKKTSIENNDGCLIINTNLTKIINDNYNYQFSLFGNKGIIQKYILHILETKYNSIVFHGCALKNSNNEVIIGLGGSGSGKSVLINIALQNGWELISTEQTIISKNMYINKGNIFDNVSPLSEELVRKKLPQAVILTNKRLVEPIGEKIFVDMTAYAMKKDKIKIDLDKLTIINVNFNGNNENMSSIADKDYLLRLLQICASEKISFPATIENDLVDFTYTGSPTLRQSIINKIIKSNSRKIMLSNGFEGFTSFFKERRS